MGLLHTKEREYSNCKEKDRQVLLASWQGIQRTMQLDEFVGNVFSDMMRKDEESRHILGQSKLSQRKRMVTSIVEWAANPPSSDLILVAARQHAHLGVRERHITLLCETIATIAISATPPKEDVDLTGAWKRCLQKLCSHFIPTCEETSEALRQARDTSTAMSSNDSAKKARAIKLLTATQPQPGYAGTLKMSQYSCMKQRPPSHDSDHASAYFRDRWVELHSQFVYYFKKHGDEKAIGLIDLALCQLVDTDSPQSTLPSPPEKYTFALLTQAHAYPYYFIAEDESSKEHWFTTFRKACNRFSLIRSDLNEGDRVKVWCRATSDFETGVVKWVGQIAVPPKSASVAQYKDGLWVGIEFKESIGICDGAMHGHRYFTCDARHGLLVPAHEVKTLGLLEIHIEGEELAPTTYRPDDFDFLTVLGKGSFGRVCKVRDKKIGTLYACKVLQKAALVKESQIRNVSREKSLLLNIRHPYIVKLHAAFQTRGRLFLLFDFLSGGELFLHMTKCPKGHFSEVRAQFYIAEVSLAIQHLHSNNIVHRDLKAENLVLDAEGHVVLTDFGFAKTIEENEANTTKCGTLPYMSPEMLRQGPNGYGMEVDWWALGVLLFLMLTGCYPFWAEETMRTVQQILEREITPECFPSSPSSLEAKQFVSKLLHKDPTQRLGREGFVADVWFKGFNWVKCLARELAVPFVPEASAGAKYFDASRCSIMCSEAGANALDASKHPAQKVEAFTSFYDVHLDYKNCDETILDDTRENMLFINALNNEKEDRDDSTPALERYLIDT